MLTRQEASLIKGLLARRDKQHDIAAFFGCNAGRVAEIATGAKFADVEAAPKRELPTPAEMTGGAAVFQARRALRIARLGIDSALAALDAWEEQHHGG